MLNLGTALQIPRQQTTSLGNPSPYEHSSISEDAGVLFKKTKTTEVMHKEICSS